jgi:hypothetical protein
MWPLLRGKSAERWTQDDVKLPNQCFDTTCDACLPPKHVKHHLVIANVIGMEPSAPISSLFSQNPRVHAVRNEKLIAREAGRLNDDDAQIVRAAWID